MASCFWRYLLALAGRLAVLSLQYSMPPLVYMKLTCKEKEKDCLTDLAKMWGVLTTLEETSSDDRACAAWLSTLGWPSQQWAREQLLSLAEDSFEQVCPSTMSEIEKYADSILSTLPIENLFNKARELASRNRRGQLEPLGLWHHSVFGFGCLAEHGLQPPPITPVAEAVAARAVPPKSSKYKDSECSIADEQFDDLCSPSPTWPAINAEGMTMNGLRWQLAMETSGCWEKMSKSWLSLLVQPGQLVLHRDQRLAALVLHSSPSGFLTCRAPVTKVGDKHFLSVNSASLKEGITFRVVERVGDWKVAAAEPLPPTALSASGRAGFHGPVILKFGKADHLVRAAAKIGFRNMPVFFLQGLLDELGVPTIAGSRPRSEVSLVEALARHALPDCTDKDIEAAMSARHLVLASAGQEASPLLEQKFRDEVLEEEDFEVAELQREYNKAVDQLQAKRVADEHRQKLLQCVFASRGRDASSSSSAPGVAKPRRFVPQVPDGYSRADAQTMCPSGYQISKDLKENRWRVLHSSGTKSKSYGKGTRLSDFEAMKWFLLQCWR